MPAAWTDRPYEAKQRGTRFKKIKRIIIKNSNIIMSGDPIMFLHFNSNWVDNILSFETVYNFKFLKSLSIGGKIKQHI